MTDRNDKREFKRFRVEGLSILQAKMDKDSTIDASIVTLGQGGCGFYSLEPERRLSPVRRVNVSIQSESTSDPIEVQGNLIYAKDIEIGERKIIFYGIEFIEAHRDKLSPIIEEIEALEADGEVESV